MRAAVFSDVHGNLPALERAIKDAGAVDQFICLGDVVNYGPWTNECIDLIASLPHRVCLIGNHEEYFLQGTYPGSNEIARAFFAFCYPTFRRRETIMTYRREPYPLGQYQLSHTIDDRYLFSHSEVTLRANHLIGHSHHQFSIRSNGFSLHNVGSVGQNRGQINVIDYAIVDSDTGDIEFRKVTYDVDQVICRMDELGYPKLCLDYYRSKPRA